MGFKRPEVQIFSLRPKNSRKQLRLFLFSLSEKFSFRRPERTRFPYFIFTRLYFRFSLLLTRFCRGAKRYSVAAFLFYGLIYSLVIVAAPYKSSHSDQKTVVSNYGCFYFLFRRSFPSGGRKGRVFPTLFLPADIFAFPFYLLSLIAGQNAIPSRLFYFTVLFIIS